MTTIEFEVRKAQIAREILNTDNIEVINAVRKTLRRVAKQTANKEVANSDKLVPYTVAEIDGWIDEAEAETGGVLSQALFDELEQKYPSLCKYK